MDIFALPGHKVRTIKNFDCRGWDYEREEASRLLKSGAVYTVKKTLPFQSRTRVYLEEFCHVSPEPSFNSVFFEDVEKQSFEDTQKHPFYIYYNGGPEPTEYY